MILNPLKKADTTDALVKALEDAGDSNSEADAVTATDTTDTSIADAAAAMTANDTSGSNDQSTVANSPDQPNLEDAAAVDQAVAQASANLTSTTTDASSAINFNSNPTPAADTSSELPAGISSDASAGLAPTIASGDQPELESVKNSALTQLRPLIEKLDLEPADKFDKYLMMLRASDDPTLIKPAFDAAQGIAGEKEKAQALLDIINEINYITAAKDQVTAA